MAGRARLNGRYRLERRLGAGADAVTWAAVDERDGAAVALKVLRRLDGEAARERFRWEFQLLAALDHPGLVRVFDLDGVRDPDGVEELSVGQPFFTAELCAGPAPAAVVPALPPAERARALCQLLADVAAALEALHREGLVHHDVKPDNLFTDGAGRTRLGDLGLSAARGVAGGLRGTPAYLPPEALTGAPADLRVDLFALGATCVALWTGRPPRAGRTAAEVLLEVARATPLPAIDAAPPELAKLVARLCAADPAERPSSARVVAEEAVRLGARLDGALLEPPPGPWRLHRPVLAGRDAELRALAAAAARDRVVLVEGPAGSGRSRLVEALRRALQLEAARAQVAPRPWHGPTVAATLRTLAPGQVPSALALAGALAKAPQVLHLDLGPDPGALERELLRLAAHGAAAPSVIIAEAPPGLPLTGDGVTRIALGPLDAGAVAQVVASMVGRADAALARAAHRASGGEPRRLLAVVQAAAAHAAPGAPPTAADVAASGGEVVEALVAAGLARLGPEAAGAIVALAALGRAADVRELAALTDRAPEAIFAALREAERLGLVALDGGRAAFPTRAHARAAEAATPPARRRALHRRALALTPPGPASARDRARHLAVVGPPGAAAAAALEAARVHLDAFELDEAEAAFEAALPGDEAAARLGLAETRTRRGDYAGARAALAPLDGEAASAEVALAIARAHQRAGDTAAAEARLRALLARTVARPIADEARGLLGRVLLERGAYEEVVAACPPDAAHPAACEARGLALLYLGRTGEAEAAFTAALAAAGDAPTARARARALLGMAAQARDDLAAAAEAYREALGLARAASELHAAAVYAGNLGTVLREQGEWALALEPTAEAARDLARLGKPVERASALFNYGNLLICLGDLDAATRAAAEARALAEAARAPREAGYARLLDADVARRRGHPDEAVAAAEDALARFGDAPRERVLGLANLAEALAEAGRADDAAARLAEAAARDAEATREAAVRVPLAADAAPPDDAVAALAHLAEHAHRTHRRPLALRADVLCARAHLRAGDVAAAATHLERAARTWEEIRMRTPELRRDAAADDPDVRRLKALLAARDAGPPASPAPPPDPRWRRLLAINKRLNSEQRLPRLLELILDTVIELTAAERGFILFAGDGGHLRVEVARDFDHGALEADAASFSRSIAERAAAEAAPIVTIDASGDERFEAAMSVSDLRLRSVLAVPLSVKGRVVGCVYADHRLRSGAFADADVQLVCDLAEQAAIAVENARLLEENARQQRRLAELNAELERRVADQALELGELKKEVQENRAALAVRYDYSNLVGRTPRMIELFRLLDRVTDTSLPVVVHGESGTGKELVARAIHHNGPRARRAFVSESCAAIPETLLEAALFGHARGAFTGATTERRGLFEIADGGTLFLDEVGEMTPAMQAKLLRVLQTGEFRRLGSERLLSADVRVIAASNRDLGRLVEEGRFREDLFYRLNVVRVDLPPLRERKDDIPLLVEHFLRKHAEASGQPPRRIARVALHKLIGYHWPGNVRELENEVLRAAALGGEVLTVEDLSPKIASADAGEAQAPEDLGLKRRVERLERSLVREAMARADGNQTRAAQLLGLSRFGLQKKLKRYRLAK